MKGRTTNERFARKRQIAPKNIDRATSSNSRDDSIDSTGSSLLAEIRKAKEAEDIIKEHGDPLDFSGKSCECIYNEYTMCFKTTPPNQKNLYHELVKNCEENIKIDLERSSVKYLVKSPAGELNDPGSGGTKVEEEEEPQEVKLSIQ